MDRGSEWRRWEFHLHTPGTQKEDRYNGDTLEKKWDNFYADIANYVGDGRNPIHSICAIAITDYLSIDNYLKVLKDNRLPDSVKFIFPNVELRIMPVSTKSPINIHCLFDPDIVDDLEDCFFAKLHFKYHETDYSATRGQLAKFGYACSEDNSLSEQEAYRKGLNQYVISADILSDVFNNDPTLRAKTIIVVSNKSNDGVSGVNKHSDYFVGGTSQLNATRQAIYQFADMIFSSNQNDINYFLGEGPDEPDQVKKKCGSLMPCIHGCDAHSNEKIFLPDEDRFCWIKANPTFEGLKQVLYEPKERVRISATFPDDKASYNVIDRVEINENSNFSPAPIYFNDKLTCIIGGKSTGKSVLLHNIARAIDETQVEKKSEIAKTNVKPISGLRVFWKDGICSSDDAQRKIVYIPQTYLNRLSDEEEETTEIDEIIQEIILQDEICLELHEKLKKNLSDEKKEVTEAIINFNNIIQDIEELESKCKDIGDENAIESELDNLTYQLEQISKNNDINEEEIKSYQSSIEESQILQDNLTKALKEAEIIKEIKSVVEINLCPEEELVLFNDFVENAAQIVKTAADELWVAKRKNILEQIQNQRAIFENSLNKDDEIVSKLKPKMDNNEQIRTLSDGISKECARLDQLKQLKEKLQTKQDQYNNYLNELSHTFEKFSNIYEEYVDNINTRITSLSASDDLEFSVKKVFRRQQFSQKILDILNQKSISRFQEINLRDLTEFEMTPSNMEKFIKSILTDSNESLQIKSSYTKEEALREILDNWYNISYIVKMDTDSIQDMSPGKKALVLLRLLISLAESKCPILIDQPEDDLDNRSIFDELIRFIKEKKIERQIIVVTHNANIVLGGDAELVLVANQCGNDAPNKRYQFEYRGGAIEDDSPVSEGSISEVGILNSKGIQAHICEILEGGEEAFALRQQKYKFTKK